MGLDNREMLSRRRLQRLWLRLRTLARGRWFVLLWALLVLGLWLMGRFVIAYYFGHQFDVRRDSTVAWITAQAARRADSGLRCVEQPPLPLSYDQIYFLSLDHTACLSIAAQYTVAACWTPDTPPALFHLQFIFLAKPVSFYDTMIVKVTSALRSIFATQRTVPIVVIVWTNDVQRLSRLLEPRLVTLLHIREWNVSAHIVETPFAAGLTPENVGLNDDMNWRGGDLMRLIVLYKYGGFYVDLDIVLKEDLAPLMTRDFVLQWSCFDGWINGAIMFVKRPRSAFIRALVSKAIENQHSTSPFAWGRDSLSVFMQDQEKLAFQILPNCFFDPLWTFSDCCRVAPHPLVGFSLIDMFKNSTNGREGSRFLRFDGSFGYHWHNNWAEPVENNSPLDQMFQQLSRTFDSLWDAGKLHRRDDASPG